MHLTATKGAQKVPDLHGPDKLTPAATGGLGLAGASVSIMFRHREIFLTIVRWRGH